MIIDNGCICIYSESRGLHPLKQLFNLKMGLLCTLVCYFDFPAFSKALVRLLKPLCGNIISLWLNSAKAAASVDKSKSGVKDFRIFSCAAEQTSKWKTNHERKKEQKVESRGDCEQKRRRMEKCWENYFVFFLLCM